MFRGIRFYESICAAESLEEQVKKYFQNDKNINGIAKAVNFIEDSVDDDEIIQALGELEQLE